MVLSDKDLLEEIKLGNLEIESEKYKELSIQPASIDLHLGNEFIEFLHSEELVDILEEEINISKYSKFEEFIINPLTFILATTEEKIRIGNSLTGFIEGRSSIGRKGVFIQNAGYIDSGFEGKITLELFNSSPRPIKIYSGMRICQLVVIRLSSPVINLYSGKY